MLGEGELGLLKVMADGRLYTLNALAEAAAQRDWEAAGRLARLAELGLVEALELRKAGRQGLERAKAYRITPEGLKAIGAQPAEPSPAARAEPSGRAEGLRGSAAAARLGGRELRLLRVMADGALWRRGALRAALAAEGAGEVAGPLGRLVELGLAEALELRTALRRQGGFASVPVYRVTPQGLALLKRGSRAEAAQLGGLEQRPPPRAGVPTPQPERRLEGLDQRALELLHAMADGRLYALKTLVKVLGWCKETVKKHLQRLAELGLVEALELRRVSWRRGELGSVKVYRIAPEGLRAIGAPQPPAPPSGAASERPSGEGGAAGQAEGRRRAWDLQLLRVMADGKLWGVYALRFALARAVGGSATSGGRRRLVKRHLKRLLERGEVEALELCTAAREGGFATVPVYRITEKGMEALKRETSRGAPPAPQAAPTRDPAELLRVMEGGGFWTPSALAKVLGWREESVRRHLQRLAELGLIEAVEVRRFSRKRKALASAYVYRVKQGGATPPSRRGAEVRTAERGGRPDLDILLAMSDGALWTITALSVATRYSEKVVRWHLRRLTALNLAEAVEVNDLATIRLYRITEKGLEALERGQLPPLESALPRGEPELPESGDPVQLAIWLVNWSAIAARVLLHLRSRNGEDSWSNVAVAGGGYRYKVNDGILGAILLRLKELNLVEWRLADPEQPAPRSARPTRIVHLTERGREVADTIIKLAALLREAESF